MKQLLLSLTFCLLFSCSNYTEPQSWTMIDVTEGSKQADSHLLVFEKDHYDLIDTGFTGLKIVPFLRLNNIKIIKNVFISHPHKDHYGGTTAIVESGVKIENFWINLPSKNFCDSEKPWGCDYEHVQSTISFLKSKGTRIQSMKEGQVLDESPRLTLQAIAAYQDTNSPTGRQGGINDTSVLMRLIGSKQTVLFTGDLNTPLGSYLAKHMDPKLLKADFLKVPHHGTEGSAPNEFFDKVSPRFAFVPAPKDLWYSERSRRIREYWEKSGAKIFVSGIHGNTQAIINEDQSKICFETHWYNPSWLQKLKKKLSLGLRKP